MPKKAVKKSTTKKKKVAKKKKPLPPVAKKNHSVIVFKGVRDRYGYGDRGYVNFYADTKQGKLTGTDMKNAAIEILRNGKISSKVKPTSRHIGSTCASGALEALGLRPRAGCVYRVKISYEITDITSEIQKNAEALAKDVKAVLKKYDKTPAKKTVKKKAVKKVVKKS